MSEYLAELFYNTLKDTVNWDNISSTKNLSLEFISTFKDKLSWFKISLFQKLPEEFIEEHSDLVCWKTISKHQNLSESFIEKHAGKLDWRFICSCQNVSEDFLRKFVDRIRFDYLFDNKKLSESFISDYVDYYDKDIWSSISKRQNFSEDFALKYADFINWSDISERYLSNSFINRFYNKLSFPSVLMHNNISDDLIRNYIESIDQVGGIITRCQIPEDILEELMNSHRASLSEYIIKHQNLSDAFMRKHIDKFHYFIKDLCKVQKLSESFIRDFKDKVSWSTICVYQKLSEPFMEEFIEYLDWKNVAIYQQLSPEFIKKHIDLLDSRLINRYQYLPEHQKESNNWLYWTKQDKLKFIKENCNGAYEIVDDHYIVAYKSVRTNNYSHYNFQYKYEVGNEYEAHCNYDVSNSNSFGLSAWTKKYAAIYNDCGKILKVHIKIEDIGAIIIDHNYKIRAKKFKVVSEEIEDML